MLVSSIFIYRNVLRGDRMKLLGNNSASIALLTISSVLAFSGQALVFTSIEYVPVDFALVLDRQSVVFQAVLAYLLLGEPWLLIEIVATFISIFGVVLIAQPVFFTRLFSLLSSNVGMSPNSDGSDGSGDSSGESVPSENGFGLDEAAMTLSDGEAVSQEGVVYGLLAAFLTACAYVTIRMMGPSRVRYASSKSVCGMLIPADDTSVPCPNVVFAASISQLALSIPCMVLSTKEEFNLSLSYSGWALLIGVAVIGTWSQLALTAGLQYEKASRTGVIRTSNVICGIFWQTISTGISPDGLTITGVILVVIGSLLILLEKNSNDVIYAVCQKYFCCCSSASNSEGGVSGSRSKPCCLWSSGCLERKGKDEMYEKLDMHDDSNHGFGGNGIELSASNNCSGVTDLDLEAVDKVGVRSRGGSGLTMPPPADRYCRREREDTVCDVEGGGASE